MSVEEFTELDAARSQAAKKGRETHRQILSKISHPDNNIKKLLARINARIIKLAKAWPSLTQ